MAHVDTNSAYPPGHRYTRARRFLASSIPQASDPITDDRAALRAERERRAAQPNIELAAAPSTIRCRKITRRS